MKEKSEMKSKIDLENYLQTIMYQLEDIKKMLLDMQKGDDEDNRNTATA